MACCSQYFRTSLDPFSGAPWFLCFLPVDLPFRNLALSAVDWHAYSCIAWSGYVEFIGCRTFPRSSSSASLRLILYSIFLHFPESGYDLRSFFSTLISHGFLFILWFLPLYPHAGENDVFWKRLAKYGLIRLAIKAVVMLGTWPVVASIFRRLSLKLSDWIWLWFSCSGCWFYHPTCWAFLSVHFL